MRLRLAAALLLALLLSGVVPSLAQTPVTIVGPITVGNCVQFFSPVQIKDAGVVCGGAAGAVQSVGNFASDTSLTIAGVGTGPWNGAVTVKLNLANANTWTAAQTFSSGLTASSITDSALASGGTQCVQASTTGLLSGTGTACGGGGGAVSSVSNADGTLTISPTTGAVVASIALGHANTWTALQKHIIAGDGILISNNASATALTNQGIDIVEDGAPGSVTITTYGIVGATNMPTFVGQSARGSLASPAVNQANDVLASFSGRGYIGSGFAAAGRGFVRVFASELWSTTGNGTYISFATTPNATTAPAEALRIENSGGVTVPPTVTGGDKGAGSINASSLFIAGTAVLTAPVSLANLATQAANTVVGNATGATASPTALAMPSCSTSGNALIWTTNTGFGCNTSITAAAVPASGLTGTTLASNVVTSSLTSVGTLTGGATGAGFTINFTASTESGLLGLTNGGTNAALTASNGGIVYSTASALAILAGTVTSGQCLLSGSSAAPTWGSCSGGAAVSSVSNADGTLTISPTTGAVVASIALGHANTWTAAQTHINSGILLLGSSTGATTFASANAGASNFTITFPAATGTVALTANANVASVSNADGTLTISPTTGAVVASIALGHANTWSGVQTFNNGDLKLAGSSSGSTTLAAAATASGTISFPAVTDTVAVLGTADQTLSGGANVTSGNLGTKTTGTTTIDCGTVPLQFLTDGGAFTLAAPSNDGSCVVLVTNNASAGTITFSGFTIGSNTGDALTTTNTQKFSIFIWRINSVAGYRVAAHQ